MTEFSRIKITTDNENRYLSGQILLAMPSIGDPRFHRAVIFICAHDDHGAMGLVLNHELPGVKIEELLSQLAIADNDKALSFENLKQLSRTKVMSGGPVETGRGFLLHDPAFKQKDTIEIDENFSVTGTIDALRATAEGKGPQDFLFILGYAGWEAGQLDQEMQGNVWLVTDASQDLIFKTPAPEMWEKAVARLGIDPAMLSTFAGNA